MMHHDAGFDVIHALDAMTVPVAVIDRQGRFRWLNQGAIEIHGERVGDPFTRVVAPEDVHLARTNFAKTLIAEVRSMEFPLTLLDADGQRVRVYVSSAPIWDGSEVVGVLGVAFPTAAVSDRGARAEPVAAAPELTARQYETLALLADGFGTAAIAARLDHSPPSSRRVAVQLEHRRPTRVNALHYALHYLCDGLGHVAQEAD
jgi:PAS domain S-box-containing protein